MNSLLQDLRYAIRTLAKAPAFTGIAVLTIALGVGANTAIFSVVHAVLLRRMPYPEPQRLVVLAEHQQRIGDMSVAWPNFLDWRKQSRTLPAMAAYRASEATASGAQEPELLQVGEVSASFFSLLGARPPLGRALGEADDRPSAPPAVVVSDELWRTRFGSDRDIVGKTVKLDAVEHTIVGVLPRGFAFFPRHVDLYRAVGLHGAERGWLSRGNHQGARVLARLAPGATLAQARSEMTAIMRQLEQQYPDSNSGQTSTVVPLTENFVHEVRPALWTLLAAVGLVLLIACANVAHLQLARASARHKELAIRVALGAGRARIVRQLVTESLLISTVGGVLGLIVGAWTIDPLLRVAPAAIPRLAETRIDPGVLLFTLAISILTGVLFGLTPALQASRPDPQAALGADSRGSTSGRNRQRFRTVLFVSEVALAFVLVIGSGLLIRSLLRVQGIAPGFNPERVLALDVSLPEAKYGQKACARCQASRRRAASSALPWRAGAGVPSTSSRTVPRRRSPSCRARPSTWPSPTTSTRWRSRFERDASSPRPTRRNPRRWSSSTRALRKSGGPPETRSGSESSRDSPRTRLRSGRSSASLPTSSRRGSTSPHGRKCSFPCPRTPRRR